MFDFTQAMEDLVRHIAETCPEFAHIRPDRVAVSHLRARSPGAHGIYGSVQPLRFKGGSLTTERRGRTYAMPQVTHNGNEILYIVYFALPRFANLDFETKLTTVFHELYHISPEFDGDIRRFPGRKYAHGYSRKRLNEKALAMAVDYMNKSGAEERTEFLRLSFDELTRRYGRVAGTRIRPPKPRVI
jgi:predicted metallopeptidase